jgi:hypothetical protein
VTPLRAPAALIAAAVLALVLSSCAHLVPDTGDDTFEALAQRELGGLTAVDLVEVSREPAGETRSVDAFGADSDDPDDWSVEIGVRMSLEAGDDEVADAAAAAHDFGAEHAGDGHFVVRVLLSDPALEQDPDLEYLPRLQLEVFPTSWRTPAESAREAVAVTRLPGVVSVAVDAGLPSVRVADASGMSAVYARLRESALWDAGGSLQSADGRVRIADVPDRQTPAGVEAILAAASAHPLAQFWLEAPTAGPRWPELYIDGVGVDEAAQIAAAFEAPAMAAANTPSFVLPFTIRAGSEAGPVDSVGTFGGVPEG